MSITLRDCLRLPSLNLGNVVAGARGLDQIVNTVSVLEFDYVDAIEVFTPNELLISALFCVKDDVEAQCRFLKRSKSDGDIGLVLFYSDLIVGTLDDRFIETADMLDFPVIVLSELKYSDVISEVMEAIFCDRKMNNNFISNTVERLAQTPEIMRKPGLVLRLASDYAKAGFFLCDANAHVIASSFWPAKSHLDFQPVKEALFDQLVADQSTLKSPGEFSYFRTSFTDKGHNQMFLCGASRNNVLSHGIMSEIVEVLQLFTVLWNYNLNVSSKEAVIPAIFAGDKELVKYICDCTGILPHKYNKAIIVELMEPADDGEIRNFMEWLIKICENDGISLITDRIGSQVVILYQDTGSTKNQIFEQELESRLKGLTAAKFYTRYHLAKLFEQLYKSYNQYAHVKDIIQKVYPYKKQFFEEDIRFIYRAYDLFYSINGEKESYLQLLEPLASDKDTELLHTLECHLLDGDSALKTTAEILFVHRNTVLYRLNKVKELLGCDLSKMPMSYEIYMAVAMRRLSGNVPGEEGNLK